MDTPICDFVRKYTENGTVRLHMPGHKGAAYLGMEALDLTEIRGADSLYEAEGIIAKSEENAAGLFGCPTFYSTEGSSQCIRAILYLIAAYAGEQGRRPLVAAARNVHKTYLTAAALLDVETRWLYAESDAGYLSCDLTPADLDRYLTDAPEKPAAVYVTSPDYLGRVADIRGLARVCHDHGVLLAVDNAHGAYLRFLPQSLHPIDLGADICCDSAHKSLPVLTGGAYLHLSAELNKILGHQVRNAMMIFGSTSPSYLILQSLDGVNPFLETYPKTLETMLPGIAAMKENLRRWGYTLYGDEPLKLTVAPKSYGYTGDQLADELRRRNMEPEFSDPDYVVLLLSAQPEGALLNNLEQVLCSIPRKTPITDTYPAFMPPEQVMTPREAMLSPSEQLPAHRCLGRVLAVPSVGCPPAVPILVCGEKIDTYALECFRYYGIESCFVVKN